MTMTISKTFCFLLSLTLILAASGARAEKYQLMQERADMVSLPHHCHVVVEMISFGHGVDPSVLERVVTYSENSDGVVRLMHYPHAQENSSALCVLVRKGADPSVIFQEIIDLFPKKPDEGMLIISNKKDIIRIPDGLSHNR